MRPKSHKLGIMHIFFYFPFGVKLKRYAVFIHTNCTPKHYNSNRTKKQKQKKTPTNLDQIKILAFSKYTLSRCIVDFILNF